MRGSGKAARSGGGRCHDLHLSAVHRRRLDRRSGGGTWDVIDPATEDVIRTVPFGGREDCRAAIDAAARAFPAWSRRTAYERGAILQKAAARVRELVDDLAAHHRAGIRQAVRAGERRVAGGRGSLRLVRRRRQARVRPDDPVACRRQAHDRAAPAARRRRRDHRVELPRLQPRARLGRGARGGLHGGRPRLGVHAAHRDGDGRTARRGGSARRAS